MQSQNVDEKQIVSILDSAFELARMMRVHPALIENAEFEKGEKLVSWFETKSSNKDWNPEMKQQFLESKNKLLCFAIEDLSNGSPVLNQCCVGFKEKNNSVLPYNINMTEFLSNKPDPQVLLQVYLKRDQSSEADQPILLSTDEMNSAIYYLIVLLSQIE